MRRPPTLWPAAAVGSLLLGASFLVLRHWLERGRLADLPVYEHYANLMRAGRMPYRDFQLEYPPAALPAFLVPAYLPWSYATSFAALMAVCGAGCLAAAAAALRAVGADELRAWAALLLIGVSPLVLGSLFDTRFDLWPALLALAALAFVLREQPLPGRSLDGAGVRREALAARVRADRARVPLAPPRRRRGARGRDGPRRRCGALLPPLRRRRARRHPPQPSPNSSAGRSRSRASAPRC